MPEAAMAARAPDGATAAVAATAPTPTPAPAQAPEWARDLDAPVSARAVARPDLLGDPDPGTAALLADLLQTKVNAAHRRIDIDPQRVQQGLGQLVLTLVKLLHVLLERQAVARMDSGALGEQEIEQLGLTLMRQAEEIDRLRRLLGLEEQDLNLDLGPLGKLF